MTEDSVTNNSNSNYANDSNARNLTEPSDRRRKTTLSEAEPNEEPHENDAVQNYNELQNTVSEPPTQTRLPQPTNEDSQTENPQPSLFDKLKWTVFRMIMFYAVMNFFKSNPHQKTTGSLSSKNGDTAAGSSQSILTMPHHNMYHLNDLLDLYVYISEREFLQSIHEAGELFWHVQNIPFACWTCGPSANGIYRKNGQIAVSKAVQNNGSIFAHVFVSKSGFSPFPEDPNFDKLTFHRQIMLNKYKKKTYRKTKNLLTGETEKDEDYQKKAESNMVEIVSHWHPNLTINLIDDRSAWIPNSVKAPLNDHIIFDHSSQTYFPILYLNNYWNLNSDYQPVNETQSSLDLNLEFSPLKFWKWQMYLSQDMQKSWYSSILGGMDEDMMDQDVLKQMLLDTNVYILAITMIVSLLHTFFEVLAFKNDIQFWKNRSNLEGLSIRTLLFNLFCNLIVVLYVLDNQTNFAVRLSVVMGLVIELWKIPKILTFWVDRSQPKIFGLIPRVRMQFKSSYDKSETSEHDKTAFKYLSVLLFPLVAGYAIYSLIYHEHKGWYSWLLSMIYGFLLTFGFIMMTPQLFINYKLKSVAHLPWRMMTYKALNTFIDDIFAFVVKTPTLYRLSCFRDDIIFFIYLYQRWIYRVDHSRVNEFGITGEECISKPSDSGEQPTATVRLASKHKQE